jgi:actin-related protein 6
VEKGYVVNWEGERAIWDFEFGEKGRLSGLVPGDVNLVLTEAPNAPHRLQEMTDQIVFEEFGFASAYRSIGW